jgi:hypothetical protein
MAKVQLTKKEADRIMKLDNKTRGAQLHTLRNYIIDKKGKEGLRMVEKRLKELGYPLNLKEVSGYKWYQGPVDSFLILVILEVFNWDESKAFEIGYDSLIGDSLVLKLLMSRLLSLKTAFKNAQKFWNYFSTTGEVKFTEYDIEKKCAIIRVNIVGKIHTAECKYIRGVLTKVTEILANNKNVKVEEIKCLFNNDPYDEFKITWR